MGSDTHQSQQHNNGAVQTKCDSEVLQCEPRNERDGLHKEGRQNERNPFNSVIHSQHRQPALLWRSVRLVFGRQSPDGGPMNQGWKSRYRQNTRTILPSAKSAKALVISLNRRGYVLD